ncbi:MAG: hypothetical protein H6R24_1833, partial [Proteobacteria bacterium]|nr:hypothetical protein [Pseudomonadota bacterium]
MWEFGKRVIFLGMLAWLISAPLVDQTAPREPWLLVDTKADTLSIMKGQRPVKVFRPIALGSSGAGIKSGRGDNRTPTGVFRIGWINDQSRFKTFIGLDYPNPDYAERALQQHRIDRATYERI